MSDDDVMVESSAESGGSIIAIRGEIVLRPGDEWPEDVREELYQCYKVTRNGARARRWYLRNAGDDAQAPALRTIQEWARFYDWPARAEAEYRFEYGALVYDSDRQSLANYAVALQVEADVLTGAFDDNPMVGAVRLKASEIAQRRHERQTKVQAPKPPEAVTDVTAVPRDEGEAQAKSAMVRRGRTG